MPDRTGEKIDLGVGECWAEVTNTFPLTVEVHDEDGGTVRLTADEVAGVAAWLAVQASMDARSTEGA